MENERPAMVKEAWAGQRASSAVPTRHGGQQRSLRRCLRSARSLRAEKAKTDSAINARGLATERNVRVKLPAE